MIQRFYYFEIITPPKEGMENCDHALVNFFTVHDHQDKLPVFRCCLKCEQLEKLKEVINDKG